MLSQARRNIENEWKFTLQTDESFCSSYAKYIYYVYNEAKTECEEVCYKNGDDNKLHLL